jgi:hypothetical protein
LDLNEADARFCVVNARAGIVRAEERISSSYVEKGELAAC